MRIRLPLGRTVFFVCAFLFALIALLPLRLALSWLDIDSLGLSARQAEGSVWLGGLKEARIGDAPLGNLSAGLSPFQLLVGRARMDVSNGQDLEGGIGVSRTSTGIDDLTGVIPVAAVFAPLPVETLDLSDVSVRFDDRQCARAEGQVKAALSGDIAGIPLAQGLTGNARCEGGALLFPLTGQSGMERLALKLFADGRYTLDLSIRPGDPALGERLSASGFRPTQQGYTLGVQGRF